MNLSSSEQAKNSSVGLGNNRDYWTRWFNIDRPWDDSGDYETIERIQNLYGNICQTGFQIFAAQCRVEGAQDSVFHNVTQPRKDSDVLTLGCTIQGLICENAAQVPARRQCRDYGIQFRCHYKEDITNTNNYFSQFDIRIYIMLALVPILVTLARVWCVMYARRKQRLQNQALGNSNNQSDDSSSTMAQPPPSYQELFGKIGNVGIGPQIFAISRDNIPVCTSCKNIQCSIALLTSKHEISELNREHTGSNQADCIPQRNEGEQLTSSELEENEPSITHQELDAPDLSQSSTGITVCRNSNETTDEYFHQTSSPHDSSVEESQVHCQETVHVENELSGQIDSELRTPKDSIRCQHIENLNTNLKLLLNTSQLKSSAISNPCACACHRTIPSKHQGLAGYENSRGTNVTSDCEVNNQSSFPDTQIPVFNTHSVCPDVSISLPVAQSDLPSYEDALDLIEILQTESEVSAL